jgi:hypothetical protein
MWSAHADDGGDRSGGWFEDAWHVVTDQRVDAEVETRAGEDVGDSTIEAMEPAPEDEQERTAAQLEAATKMANAFLNLSYESVEADFENVSSQATGPFLKQWSTATTSKRGLAALLRRSKATQTGEVVWAGLIAGDDDSADVVLATNGTVANKVTDFEPQARTYRLQLHLELVDGRWLTSDLQYVR